VKIFLTVGSMLPFDRLVRAMDIWAKAHPEAQIFAQIGKTSLRPENMEYQAMISPSEYREHFAACDVVVSHVGMGTVITALECRKPLVMVPRQPELHEVTSNHQLATAKWLDNSPGIRIVFSENDLAQALSESEGSDGVSMIETGSRGRLIDSLRQFISN
jgi:UDP-N-acetylglucosamine transferase subunit ALG13